MTWNWPSLSPLTVVDNSVVALCKEEPKMEGAMMARKVRVMGRLVLMMHKHGSRVVQRKDMVMV